MWKTFKGVKKYLGLSDKSQAHNSMQKPRHILPKQEQNWNVREHRNYNWPQSKIKLNKCLDFARALKFSALAKFRHLFNNIYLTKTIFTVTRCTIAKKLENRLEGLGFGKPFWPHRSWEEDPEKCPGKISFHLTPRNTKVITSVKTRKSSTKVS